MSTQPLAKIMNSIRGDQPWKRESALTRYGDSVAVHLNKDGLRDAGVDVDNPGGCTQWYFPKYKVAVIDLGGNFDGDE